jgi:hypothetical protein
MGVRCVDTIANLKAVNTATLGADTSNNTVLALGYYAAGDGGGGYFQFVSSSAVADDGGGVIAPNAGSGRWLRRLDTDEVTLAQFGCRGDGTTNDTTQLQRCINYANTSGVRNVFVPPTNQFYNITATLAVPGLMRIYGVGYASAIKMTPTSGTGLDVTQPNMVNITGSDVTIESIRLFGMNIETGYYPQTGGTSEGIRVATSAPQRIVIRNCFLHHIISNAIAIKGGKSEVVITGNTLFGNNGNKNIDIAVNGLSLPEPLERVIITDNYCLSNCDQGIKVADISSRDILIARNHIVPILDTGAAATGAACMRRHGILIAYALGSTTTGNRIVISDNIIRHTKWTGIYINDGLGGWIVGPYVISGNYISDIGYEAGNTISGGISVIGSGKGDVFTANRVERTFNDVPGIKISHSQTSADDKTCVVSHNSLSDCSVAGVLLIQNGHNSEITGNLFTNNTEHDIRLQLNTGSTLEHKNMIADNKIQRNNTNFESIHIDSQSSTCVTWIFRNHFTGSSSATLADSNSAVLSRTRFVNFRENYVKNFYYGVFLQSYVGGRELLTVIDDNYFENVNTAVRAERTTTTPILPVSGNRYSNVTTKAGPAGVVCKRNPSAITQYLSAAPTTGTWVAGDVVYNSAPAVGQPIGWMRTSSAWRSVGNLA